jgi:hypothetical protein
MPSAWTRKDERKYEHIKKGYLNEGMTEDKAEEIAARTVNKDRRLEGRTPSKHSQGTGNPRTRLDTRTIDELRNRAAELGVEGAGSKTKDELVEAIREKE